MLSPTLALRFRYGPRVPWCDGISGHVSLAFKMSYWIDESPFSITILNEKSGIVVGNERGLLPVHHSASLISILRYHYLHSTVWKDWSSISNRSTGHLYLACCCRLGRCLHLQQSLKDTKPRSSEIHLVGDGLVGDSK